MRIVSLVDNVGTVSGEGCGWGHIEGCGRGHIEGCGWGHAEGCGRDSGEGCGCEPEHGVSLYIETGNGLKVLFDTGQSDLFARNAARLGIDLREVDLAVISHGHYDHGGGLNEFLRINTKAPVYIRESALGEHYSIRPSGVADIGLKINDLSRLIFTKDIEILPGGITLFTTPTRPASPGSPATQAPADSPCPQVQFSNQDDGHLTSQAPADSPCPQVYFRNQDDGHLTTQAPADSPYPQAQFSNHDYEHQSTAAKGCNPFPEPDGTFREHCPFPEPFGNRLLLGADRRPDDFRHEQSMIIRDGSSTVLFGGCAHRGIVNILAQAQALTSGTITHVLSGFHLSKTVAQININAGQPCDAAGQFSSTIEQPSNAAGQFSRTIEQPSNAAGQFSSTAGQISNTAAQLKPDGYLAVLAQALSSFPGIEYYTMHCTGEPAFTRLAAFLSPRLHYLPCGSTLTL